MTNGLPIVAPPLQIGPHTKFYNLRPATTIIDMVVVHAIGQYIEWDDSPTGKIGAVTWLTEDVIGRPNGVSAHAYIDPNGTVWRICDDEKRAWHAGVSEWNGETGLNKNSLGVELAVTGTHNYSSFLNAMKRPDCYTNAQYLAVGWLIWNWCQKHNIPRNRVVGHSQISGDDVRGTGKGKQDPGVGFNWNKTWSIVDRWEN